jgi:hypothetical protein
MGKSNRPEYCVRHMQMLMPITLDGGRDARYHIIQKKLITSNDNNHDFTAVHSFTPFRFIPIWDWLFVYIRASKMYTNVLHYELGRTLRWI